jgi:hypothetical protein
MKKRNGFVSNSSTSSFCIVGVCFTDEKETKVTLESIFAKLGITKENGCNCDIDRQKLQSDGLGFCPSCGKPLLKKYSIGDISDKLRPECHKLGIRIIYDEYALYLGRSIGSEGDGEKVSDEIETMQNTYIQLKDWFGEDVDVRVYTGETYG